MSVVIAVSSTADIVNLEKRIVIECKRYTWTETGNVPSAKMLKEIANERGVSYDTLKRRAYELRCNIREEIIECLELNCREVV